MSHSVSSGKMTGWLLMLTSCYSQFFQPKSLGLACFRWLKKCLEEGKKPKQTNKSQKHNNKTPLPPPPPNPPTNPTQQLPPFPKQSNCILHSIQRFKGYCSLSAIGFGNTMLSSITVWGLELKSASLRFLVCIVRRQELLGPRLWTAKKMSVSRRII